MQIRASQILSHDNLRRESKLIYMSYTKSVFLLVLALFNSKYWIMMLNYLLKSLTTSAFRDDHGTFVKIGKKALWNLEGFLCLEKLWMKYKKSTGSRSNLQNTINFSLNSLDLQHCRMELEVSDNCFTWRILSTSWF